MSYNLQIVINTVSENMLESSTFTTYQIVEAVQQPLRPALKLHDSASYQT